MKKVIFVIIEAILLAMFLVYAISAYNTAFAEDDEYFIMCQPDSFVNVRFAPKKDAQEVGFLELGDGFRTNGEKRNGFLRIVDEFGYGIGWVSVRYVVPDKPVIETFTARNISRGRVSCRKYVNGPRRKWLKYGAQVTVYAYSEEWAVTNQGFVRIRCLEAE